MTTRTRRTGALTNGGAWLAALLLGFWTAAPARANSNGAAAAARLPAVRTLFIIGDSTVKNDSKGLEGWGTAIAADFDPAKINVVNRARGGRSSRTFLTEGLWAQVLDQLKPGDFVLMQFGHNDGGEIARGNRPRASLKGIGDEAVAVTVEMTGQPEVVHTYGWYLRQFIEGAKSRGATPIVLSPVPRDMWKNGRVIRNMGDYGSWARAVAEQEGVAFVDLNAIIAQRYDELGADKVRAAYFPGDHTHTSPAGAALNAASVIAGLKGLKACGLCAYLSAQGENVPVWTAPRAED